MLRPLAAVMFVAQAALAVVIAAPGPAGGLERDTAPHSLVLSAAGLTGEPAAVPSVEGPRAAASTLRHDRPGAAVQVAASWHAGGDGCGVAPGSAHVPALRGVWSAGMGRGPPVRASTA
jgi:hypothetical protein